MKWLYRNLHKKEKGFTLVELMVVIIILAVLTAIAIPSYMVLRNRAREQATRSEMQNIGTAIAVYEADEEEVPQGALADLTSDLETDGYMTNVPQEDAWGADYTYLGDADGYTLTSDGGDDDIVFTNGEFTGDETP